MLEFFARNWATLLVGGAVAALLILVSLKLIRDRRAGKSTCGCNCADCPSGGVCHPKK